MVRWYPFLNNKKGAYLGEKEKLFQIQKSLKKIPGAQKIINGNNEIIWVINHRIDDRYKITESSKKVLKISYNKF